MVIELKVPAAGESITEVIVAEWLKPEGAFANRDEPVALIETDKANVELLAPVQGTVAKILKQAGETARVGETIALLEPATANEALIEPRPLEAGGGATQPRPREAAGTSSESRARDSASETRGREVTEARARDLASETRGREDAAEARTREGAGGATSEARARAAGAGIRHDIIAPAHGAGTSADADAGARGNEPLSPSKRRALREARGSNGPGTEPEPPAPVTRAPAPAPAPARTAPAPAAAPRAQAHSNGARAEEIVPMSPLRRKVAERLVTAQQTAAMLTTFNELDMTQVMSLRKAHQEAFKLKHNTKLGFMSFFIKATIEALKTYPALNAEIRNNTEIIYHHYYDIGVAVGGGKGLVVPVIRNAEQKSFAELEKTIADFGERAKQSRLKLEELQGGTFSISNGGVYGSMMSTPILNPPQSGILGMHAIQDRPVARDGTLAIAPMMYVALTYDHRIVDGREAVGFLVRIKECIENPARMLLEV